MSAINVNGYSYDATTLAEGEMSKAVAAAKAAGKGSPLTILALVLAVVATKMTNDLMSLATQIGDIKTAKANNPKAGDMNETVLTALLQADTQKLSMFMQAMSNAIKTLGEAETAVARKG